MRTIGIKRAVLAAATFAAVGMASGAESALQVVFCKATIVGNNGGEDVVSVTLPPTEGYYDDLGNPLTYWNVGNVPVGGVADSWHAEGGPGRFTARNAGNVGSYFYVTTSGGQYDRFTETDVPGSDTNVWVHITSLDLFGQCLELWSPAISPNELRRWQGQDYASYHLAFTTDTTAKVPTWHSLDHRKDGHWSTEESSSPQSYEVAGYMGYVEAGDYLTFDLKFWAPSRLPPSNVMFTFCVEASSFPLWEHSRVAE